ncbi:MAG: RNA polymerase sigma factor [Bacteroidales bacterium]|nr:RNA polymerase sigma factor [Bacteroidales bacterium]
MTQTEFRTTWLPLSDALYRVAFYMLEDEADAKDAVQDLYVKLLAKSPEGVQNPRAYAITMLRNMCIDRIRIAQKFFSLQCAEDAPGLDFMEREPDVLATKEKLRRVLAIIEGLPDKQREVVRQRIFEEREYSEIARNTGLTEGDLRVLLSIARKRIRKEYERYQ